MTSPRRIDKGGRYWSTIHTVGRQSIYAILEGRCIISYKGIPNLLTSLFSASASSFFCFAHNTSICFKKSKKKIIVYGMVGAGAGAGVGARAEGEVES